MAAIDICDDSLLSRLTGDLDGAFAEVVSEFEGALYTTALRLSGRPGEAEDLAAETFLKAYAALRHYSRERIEELQLRPWLITICLNLWRNQVRAAARRPQPVAHPLPEGPAIGESPERQAERHDQTEKLAAVLLQLPEKQRAAVVLRHVVGLPYAEVAEVLGCPESTAKSHVHRALDRLRVLLTNNPEVLS